MADILGNIVSGIFGIGGQAQQFAHESALQQQQNEFNLQMWKLNNEYNSPQAQMERFKAAGLNPNLIYGNGSNGNSSSPPVMGTPHAPDYTKSMEKLANAFNIEGLRTQIAQRKKVEADADNARTDATRNSRQLFAEERFGANYTYDYNKGIWVPRPRDPEGQVTIVHPSSMYFNRILENNFNKAHLIPFKQRLYEPEIWMRNYEREHYPTTYWIGQSTRAVHGAAEAVGIFTPKNWFVPRTSYNPYFNNY